MKKVYLYFNQVVSALENSPDLSSGGLMRNRGGGPRPKNKKRNRNKGNLGYKILKFLGLNKGKKHGGNRKIACGPGGCN